MRIRWGWVILIGSIAVIGLILSYPAAIFWEMHQVDQLCAELRPGTPYANIRQAIEKRGLWNPLVAYQFDHEDSRYQKDWTWEIAVPAVMTLGDMECSITHNHGVVLFTEVLGP
jgi:hypothetical protein